eukprot:892361-Pyramimonas_sp.AAC.1
MGWRNQKSEVSIGTAAKMSTAVSSNLIARFGIQKTAIIFKRRQVSEHLHDGQGAQAITSLRSYDVDRLPRQA